MFNVCGYVHNQIHYNYIRTHLLGHTYICFNFLICSLDEKMKVEKGMTLFMFGSMFLQEKCKKEKGEGE